MTARLCRAAPGFIRLERFLSKWRFREQADRLAILLDDGLTLS